MSTFGITHAVDNRNLAAYLDELNKKIRQLTDKICCLTDALGAGGSGGACETVVENTQAGTNIDVPAGFRSISITKTSNNGGPVNIALSDSSIFPLDLQYESFVDSASLGSSLPAYIITSGTGETWKWHGINTITP